MVCSFVSELQIAKFLNDWEMVAFGQTN